MEHELVTIAFSHFCEKARWALDRYGVRYREQKRMPMFHLPAVWVRTRGGKRGKADRASTPFSTPLLTTRDGEVLTDSSDIVRWVDRHHAGGALYPSAEVRAFEDELGTGLGPHSRRLAYFFLLAKPELIDELADRNVSRRQAVAFKAISRVAMEGVKRRLQVNAQGARRSEEKVWQTFDAIAERLADGRPYLFGDRFTAGDLAFASLAAPSVFPKEFGAWLPELEALPAEGRARIERARAHPAGQFALRMFAEERALRV